MKALMMLVLALGLTAAAYAEQQAQADSRAKLQLVSADRKTTLTVGPKRKLSGKARLMTSDSATTKPGGEEGEPHCVP